MDGSCPYCALMDVREHICVDRRSLANALVRVGCRAGSVEVSSISYLCLCAVCTDHMRKILEHM
jgi:hypothetical protein